MFRPRRRYGGHRRGGGIGIFMLGLQLFQLFNVISRSNDYFPVTLGVLGLNILAYLQPGVIAWPSLQQACISVQGLWFQKQWKRLLFSPFFHSSDFHLYYNMASFIWKAISLEKHFGTPYFLYMISVFSVGTGGLYIGINYMLAEMLDQWSYIQSCAVGFSGVVFALKVVTTHMQPAGMTRVMGILPVPMRLACWVELVLISVLFPNVSFVGHLAGILVGLAFVSGPLKTLMDIPLSLGAAIPREMGGHTGRRTAYTYRAENTGYRDRNPRPDPEPADTEEQELQAAIQHSLQDQDITRTTPMPPQSPSHSEDPPPPNSAPLSYNPYYSTSDVDTNETTESAGGVRRRPVSGTHPVTGTQDTRDSFNTVRSARLKRFSKNT